MKLTKDILKKMVRTIQMTRPDEIGCGECYKQLIPDYSQRNLVVGKAEGKW